MRVWVDTDIFLDVLLDRQPHTSPASRIAALAQNRLIEGYVAPITINNIYYIARKDKSLEEIKRFLQNLTRYMHIGILDHDTVKIANHLGMNDYEDALQYAMASRPGRIYL